MDAVSRAPGVILTPLCKQLTALIDASPIPCRELIEYQTIFLQKATEEKSRSTQKNHAVFFRGPPAPIMSNTPAAPKSNGVCLTGT